MTLYLILIGNKKKNVCYLALEYTYMCIYYIQGAMKK